MENSNIIFLMLIIGILSMPIVVEKIEYINAIYLFENNEYDLQELIEKNNLTEQEPLMSYCFDTNEEIKELAENLTTVYDVQKWILDFKNADETEPLTPKEILEKGTGDCLSKSCLACSILANKGYDCCILISNGKYDHSIFALKSGNKIKPLFPTGYISSQEELDDFMNNLWIINCNNKYYETTI